MLRIVNRIAIFHTSRESNLHKEIHLDEDTKILYTELPTHIKDKGKG